MKKVITFIFDTPVALTESGVLCKSGKVLHADMIVNASGCKFNANPQFLQTLKLGKLLYHLQQDRRVCGRQTVLVV